MSALRCFLVLAVAGAEDSFDWRAVNGTNWLDCCGYEVRRCPFTEMDSDRSKMRLSPVFVERLQRHNLMD